MSSLQHWVEPLAGVDYRFDFIANADLRCDHKFSCLSLCIISIIIDCDRILPFKFRYLQYRLCLGNVCLDSSFGYRTEIAASGVWSVSLQCTLGLNGPDELNSSSCFSPLT